MQWFLSPLFHFHWTQKCCCLLFRQVLPQCTGWRSGTLTQWPYGFCWQRGHPGAGLPADQSGNDAPPTEINTHFLSSLSHWFFPHSLNSRAVVRPAQRKWPTTSRDWPALTGELMPACASKSDTLALVAKYFENIFTFLTLLLNQAWPWFTRLAYDYRETSAHHRKCS